MSIYGYRRGSIFWALTLIAVGAIFLYNNFNPAVRPWHVIAKFWPILIIFWGLSKLMDYLHAHAHPETAPPSLFTASEVVLLMSDPPPGQSAFEARPASLAALARGYGD